MNWVEGETLDEWVRHRRDRNPIDDLKVLVPVAAASDLMHSGRATGGVPVVHRDIKPANILVTEHGSVLVDFGLTRGLPDGERLTGVVGTPGYLAPESTGAGTIQRLLTATPLEDWPTSCLPVPNPRRSPA